jgi:hypothetical protein
MCWTKFGADLAANPGRVKLRAHVTSLILGMVFFSNASFAGQLEIPKEARKKWSEYMEGAKRIQGSSSEVLLDRLANNSIQARNQVELKMRGFCLAYSFQFLERPQLEPEQHWYVRNQRYGFELRRKLNTDPWAIVQYVQKIGDGKNHNRLSFFLSDQTTRTFAPLRIAGKWLPEMSQQSDFLITNIAQVAKNDLELIRVEFRITKLAQRKPALESGWFLLDPSLYWVVREYDVNMISGIRGNSYSGKNSYTGNFKLAPSGIPLLVKSIERLVCPAEKADGEWVIDYYLHEREVPESEFTLSAFGFK